jgi:Zn-dependent protease with chaperone function
MRFLALGSVLASIWFLVIDAALTAVVAGIARACRDAWADHPASRARVLFLLRLLPGGLAALFVVFGFVPTFWRFEPHDTIEAVSPLLLAGWLAAALLVALAIGRGWRAARHARRAAERCLHDAVPLTIDGDLRAAVVGEGASTIALVGIAKPRLFIARRVLETLTPAELEAVVAHERGHQRSRDNLKRLCMAWWPGALALTATGAWLEREWVRAAELAADAAAAGANATRALDLASALVKVARLASVPPGASALHSTLHDGSEIATRVRRLAALTDTRPADPAVRYTDVARAALAAAAGFAFLLFCAPQVPSILQQLTEFIVRFAA